MSKQIDWFFCVLMVVLYFVGYFLGMWWRGAL